MNYYQRPHYQIGFGGASITLAVKYLIISNAVIFLLQNIIGNKLIFWFGLFPQQIYTKFYLWQLGTYMFLHGNFLHILLNMFILWMFGCEVERFWGVK